jgi:hypothetical protein
LECGEIVSGLYAAGRDVVANIFPKQLPQVTNTSNLLPLLQNCVPEVVERLRSAARGGAKLALGLVRGHYPEVNMWRVIKCFPAKDRDGNELVKEKVYASVSGFASAVAEMVDLSIFFSKRPVPPRPDDVSDDEAEPPTTGNGDESEDGNEEEEEEGESEAALDASKSPAPSPTQSPA